MRMEVHEQQQVLLVRALADITSSLGLHRKGCQLNRRANRAGDYE